MAIGSNNIHENLMNAGDRLRMCPYCKKQVIRIAEHIIRIHPNIIEQLTDMGINSSQGGAFSPPVVSSTSQPHAPPERYLPSLSEIIRQKVDDLLGIEVIKALSSSDSSKIADLAKVLNPPKETSLDEIKRYHDIFYHDNEQATGSTWADLVKEALPVIGEGFKGVNEAMKNKQQVVRNVREANSGSPGSIKPIELKVAGDTAESGSIS